MRRHDRALAALAGVLVVVVAVVGILLSRADDPAPDAEALPVGDSHNGVSGAVAPTPAAATGAPQPSPTPVTSSATTGPPPRKARSFPLLQFIVVRNTWVSVKRPDGSTVKVGVFKPGAVYTYDAPRLTIRTGNAGGTTFFVNGKKRREGVEGQIEEFTVRRPGA